jgi:predicted nucleic acid-binding protein
MATLLTLDASVFINAHRPQEKGHAASRLLLTRIHELEIPVLAPAILPAEVAGVWARETSRADLAREFAATLLAFPWLHVLPATAAVSRLAADVAAAYRLRGMDAFYVATARQHGAMLVTFDDEQLRRAPVDVCACTPDHALPQL